MPDRSADVRRAARNLARQVVTTARKRRRAPVEVEGSARGAVEIFDETQIVGWVAAEPDAPAVRVSLYLNDDEAVGTWAAEPVDRPDRRPARSFRLALRDVWRYCGTGDRLSVRVEGQALPLPGGALGLRPARDGRFTPRALRRRIDEGYVFSHGGTLQLSKSQDVEWQRTVLDLYDRVRRVVAEEFGPDVFAIYGSLLGAVREGGFIGHDRDFDCAFISSGTAGRAAALELQQIAFALIADGLDIECRRTALHVHDETDPSIRIDLFHLFFDRAGQLCFPFGIAGTTTVTKDDWGGTEEIEFAGRNVLIPANAEALAEHIYGASWRLPQPGFNWARDRTTRAKGGLLRHAQQQEVYWANFYARHSFDQPSPFGEWLLGRPDLPATVVELGCGDGRDALAFAGTGRRVLGLDRSPAALARATARAATLDLTERARFEVIDLDKTATVRTALTDALGAADGAVLVYLRFVLHALVTVTQDALLAAIAECVRPGDLLALEFRALADEERPKAHPDHYRRFLDGAAVRAALETELGFHVLEDREGDGLARYRDEDPVVRRLLARRV